MTQRWRTRKIGVNVHALCGCSNFAKSTHGVIVSIEIRKPNSVREETAFVVVIRGPKNAQKLHGVHTAIVNAFIEIQVTLYAMLRPHALTCKCHSWWSKLSTMQWSRNHSSILSMVTQVIHHAIVQSHIKHQLGFRLGSSLVSHLRTRNRKPDCSWWNKSQSAPWSTRTESSGRSSNSAV